MREYTEVSTRAIVCGLLLLFALVGTHVYEATIRARSATSLVKKALPSVVVIECYTPAEKKDEYIVHTTAGFVASNYGHIVTVAHGLTECTAKNQRNIVVRFWQNPRIEYRATILRIDKKQDAAILQVPTIPRNIPPLEIDTSIQEQGQKVITIGHPQFFYWSVADGVVSSDRLWAKPPRHLLQVSIPITSGNSGGPILNEKGKVIGVVSFTLSTREIVTTEGGEVSLRQSYIDLPLHSLAFLIPMDTILYLARGIYF